MKKLFYLLMVSFILFSCSKKEDEEILNEVEAFTPTNATLVSDKGWKFESGVAYGYGMQLGYDFSKSMIYYIPSSSTLNIQIYHENSVSQNSTYYVGKITSEKIYITNSETNYFIQEDLNTLVFITNDDLTKNISYRKFIFKRVK